MSAAPAIGARIGPNAIIQTIDVLRAWYGQTETQGVLQRSDNPALLALLDELPAEMVDEQTFHALVHHLVAQVGDDQTARILERSGQQTADYLLAHRIPRPFQALVKPLPPRPGMWLLLTAIKQHAWTFVGSGQFTATCLRRDQPPTLALRLIPTAAPVVAHFFGGTFTRLLQVLIAPHTSVTVETLHEHNQNPDSLYCRYVVQLNG